MAWASSTGRSTSTCAGARRSRSSRPELAEASGFRERFNREARIAAALQHPNIVTVYDAGEEDGLLYLAMQYIEGSDLSSVLRSQGRLRPVSRDRRLPPGRGRARRRARQGLIHRDVKPANVLIEGRTAFLTDFGLTKRIEGTQTQLTKAGDVVGTIHYVAPEQIEGGRVDARTDIYSLGCLLYHCLSGELPFARDTDVAVIYAHLSEEPPRLTSVRPELPGGLDAVIAKALEKSPERRFQTCADLMSAARAVIDAAGPLADTATPRPVPAFGDHFDVPTVGGSGRRVPAAGDYAVDARRASGARRRRPRRGGAAPARAARRPRRRHARGRARGGRRPRRRRGGAGRRVAARHRARRPPRPRDPRLERARASRRARSSPRCAPTPSRATRRCCCWSSTSRRRAATSTAAGADDRLAAPFSPLQLQVKLRKLLGADAVAG